MSTSNPSSKKKTKTPKSQHRKIYYAFFLLLGANIIVFSFFAYFVAKLSEARGYSQKNPFVNIHGLPTTINNIPNTISATSFVIYDPLTRTVIASRNPNLRLSPASSIKVITALVSLEHYDLNDYLFASTATFDESKMGLVLNEQVRVEDLLYGLLLISGNDAAKTLAGSFPGGREAFIEAMNNKARAIGLVESSFVDPSGYEDNNYSTAFEMALLGAHVMENTELRKIVGTREMTVYDRSYTHAHYLTNLNELLVDKNVTGIKTGFTNEAGGVLLTSYIHQGRELIIVVMKSTDRFYDTRQIINFVNENVSYSVPSV